MPLRVPRAPAAGQHLFARLVAAVSRQAQIPLEGTLRLAGPVASIPIVRDTWGIPHINATCAEDAFFAQGFCHAQDRFWQMEIGRRLARGRLAEVLGSEAAELDRLIRRIGFHRAAEAEWLSLDDDSTQALVSYTAGVNACLQQAAQGKPLSVELALAGINPQPWEPLDSLSFARYFAFSLSPNWDSELMRSRLIARLGRAGAASLEPDVWQADDEDVPELPDWGPFDAPSEGPLPTLDLRAPSPGSNAWAVSGQRSATGAPLLANDPHLIPHIPAVFYEVHLVGGTSIDVIGASIPGTPGVVIGHNQHIAWGITASMADVQDFFVESVKPGEPTQLRYRDSWVDVTAITERIRVRGSSSDLVDTVLIGPHGPLLTPAPALPDEDRALALSSSVLQTPEMLRPLLALNRASDWHTFRDAVRDWGTPSLSLAYADVHGTIASQVVGRIPVRGRGKGLVPAPGWTGEYDWTGWVPFEELAWACNPSDGIVANANQEPPRTSTAFLGREFVDSARYRRIRQVLESQEKHSLVSMAMLQADELSLPAREIARILAARARPRNQRETDALALLRSWDGRIRETSAGAALYEVFRNELIRRRYQDELKDLLPALFGVGPHPLLGPVWSAYFLQTTRVLRLMKDWETGRGEDRVFDEAFQASVECLRLDLGNSVRRWAWGKLHQLRLRHALSLRPPLGLVFDVPSFPWGGDLETVSAGGYLPGTLEAGGTISGYRFLADCSDWDATLSVIPGGQSGHRQSRQYDDQVKTWRRWNFHQLAYSPTAVKKVGRHTLNLVPGTDSSPVIAL